jgi:hypothetical protein
MIDKWKGGVKHFLGYLQHLSKVRKKQGLATLYHIAEGWFVPPGNRSALSRIYGIN